MAEPCLYIVATPIGNLQDLSPRAQDVLAAVDLIAAEDTRHSSRLLNQFDIRTPLFALHDHNERQRAQVLVDKLAAGQSIALISDAGTPLISDPGYHLVRRVREAGMKVVPVPGCCAMVAALSTSGLPSDRFFFEGFLPAKSKGRREKIEALAELSCTWILYESPHRILDTLSDLNELLGGEREIVVARELTKTFETFFAGTLAEADCWIRADSNQQRGEFVLLLAGKPEAPEVDEVPPDARRVLELLLEELSVKQASALAAKITGLKKKMLYTLALELQSD